MQTFEKVDEHTIKVISSYIKEDNISKDQIVLQMRGHEEQIAILNGEIAKLQAILDEADKLGVVTCEEKLLQEKVEEILV